VNFEPGLWRYLTQRAAGDEITHLLRRHLAPEVSVRGDGDRRGLLGHDDDERVTLFAQAECGAVTRAERSIDDRRLRERQNTSGADDRVATNQNGSIMQRGVSEARFTIEGRSRTSPVILGEAGEAALLGAVTLETLGLMVNPLNRRVLPMRMTLSGLQ